MSNNKPDSNEHNESRSGAARFVAIAVGLLVVAGVPATLLSGCAEKGSTSSAEAARQAALASDHSPTLGDPGAKVHIVEFLDPACGTCALFYPMVKGWMAEVPGEIRLSIRHVAFHTGADYAVRILEASRNQGKYWETLEALLAGQGQWVRNHIVQPDNIGPVIAGVGLDMSRLLADMNSAEVTQRIEKDRNDAVLLKVSATPEYFVNGRPLPSFGQQQLANLVREELGR
jgi:protein-disulfide isomerase